MIETTAPTGDVAMSYCPRAWCEAHLTGAQHSTNCPDFGTFDLFIDGTQDYDRCGTYESVAAARSALDIIADYLGLRRDARGWTRIGADTIAERGALICRTDDVAVWDYVIA